MSDKKIKKLLNFSEDKDLAFFDELQEITEVLEGVKSTLEDAEENILNGENGKDADEEIIIEKVLARIPEPKKGLDASVDYEKITNDVLNKIKVTNGIDGIDGIDGTDAEPIDIEVVVQLALEQISVPKDGSPDMAEDIRNKLELLSGDERLDIKAVKGVEEKIDEVRKIAVQKFALPPTTTHYYKNGTSMGRAKNINFSSTGSAEVSVNNDSATVLITYVSVSATVPSSPNINDLWVDIS